MGEGSGEEREDKLNAKRKQTNKEEKWDGAGRRKSLLSFKYHIQWPGLQDAKPLLFSPVALFFCYCHFPC